MVGDFPLITTTQYNAETEKWLKAIGRGEDACILFLPKTDREIRLGQLLNDRELQRRVLGTPASYIFLRVNFDAHDVEDIDDFSFQVQERLNSSPTIASPRSFLEWMEYLKKQSMRLVLILLEAERYLNLTDKTALAVLSEAARKYSPLLRVLSVFETNITHASMVPFLPTSVDLYENIFHYPLYEKLTTVAFIQLLCHQWQVAVPQSTVEQIINACGGHFWLVKEAVRQIATKGSWSSAEEGMQFRLRSFYNLLLPSEQTALYKLATRQRGFSTEEQMSLTYLQTMRVIDSKHHFLVDALRDVLLHREDLATSLVLSDSHILLKDIPIEKMFSRKEHRVVRLLLARKGIVVTRDEIAKSIWPVRTVEQYSDWAIDQLVARVRKRFLELSLSPKIIKVVRGKGYQLQ